MNYQVVFTGDLRSGYSRRQGIEYLAEKFQLEFEHIRSLLRAKRTVVKTVPERQQGEALVTLFWQGGWIAEIVATGERPEERSDYSDCETDLNIGQKIFSESSHGLPRCSLQLPNGWQICAGLNPSAVLQVGNTENDQFLVVLRQGKSELLTEVSLKDYCGAQLNQCMEKVPNSQIIRKAEPMHEAQRFQYVGEFSAEVSETPIQYMVAASEDGLAFYTHIFWCEQVKFERARSDFLKILASFRIELEANLASVRKNTTEDELENVLNQ